MKRILLQPTLCVQSTLFQNKQFNSRRTDSFIKVHNSRRTDSFIKVHNSRRTDSFIKAHNSF